MQSFKSVYFADHPANSAKRRHLKLAFGAKDVDLYGAIRPLASEDIRRLLGCETLAKLKNLAAAEGSSLNAFSLRRLRRATAMPHPGQKDLFKGAPAPELGLNPIQATCRGGATEPLHGWYPYLESYSPAFVKELLTAFAPSARHVLDPFAGTGTTPLAVASMGRQAYYCELNPLLQFLTETKVAFLAMSARDRLGLAARLRMLAERLDSCIAGQEPDRRLARAHAETFGASEFFDNGTFETCLKVRTWLDLLGNQDPNGAKAATVAAVASLLPCSNMIRRGDLRFRRGQERAQVVPDFVCAIREKLRSMANDLGHLRTIDRKPILIAEDAKRLAMAPNLGIDVIITSPPYLNGTNYYRNTKIELWFLRALSSVEDLTAYRRRTLTAGINDVQATREAQPVSRSVENLVSSLRERAYDRRVPIMAAHYFADMKQVFAGLSQRVKAGAKLLLDIGDSSYAGIHVDTPTILAELLGTEGWRFEQEVHLRSRLSRNRQRLRQVLLVATAPRRSRRKRLLAPLPKWEAFKRELPHQRGDFGKRNWGSPLHSLCSYQGKLKPAIAHHLVRAFASPGDRLLDPFGGVGTIAFEAALHGVTAWSFDISPVAVSVASAKLAPAAAGECLSLIDELRTFLQAQQPTAEEREAARLIHFNGALPEYFHPKTLDEILLARRFFGSLPVSRPGRDFVLSCLLHVLHGNRPYALSRRSHPITPFAPTGSVEYKALVEKLAAKVQRSLAAKWPPGFANGSSLFQDATDRWPDEVDQLDAIITSPPFFDSTRFHLANWMRLWFAGWSRADFQTRPRAFVDERQKQGFEVYQPVIRQARERLKPGGACVFHLGKSRKCDMAQEVVNVARPWFRKAEVFSESVAHCESHGIRDKGTVVEHTYLVMTS